MESTHRKIQVTPSSLLDEPRRDDTRPYLRETDICELKAVVRLMYFSGLLRQNNHHVKQIFSEHSGHSAFVNKRNFSNYRRIRLLVNTTFRAILCGPPSVVQTVREETLKRYPPTKTLTRTPLSENNE